MHTWAASRLLAVVFGCLLLLAAASELTGMARRVRFTGPAAWLAGGLSGAFGGLVGNQGGIRSAALLGFDLPKSAFVATSTAVAFMVDAARMPVYFWAESARLAAIWPLIAAALAGVVLGTVLGARVLGRVPEARFRQVVALLLATLGGWMLLQALRIG